jgi:hypothetical protein
MINYQYANLFAEDSTSKQVTIEYEDTLITNDDLFNQEITLEESLCSSKELRFGACEASILKFKVANIVAPMSSKWINVKMVLNNHADAPFTIGRYKVAKDTVTADRRWRNITAYDALYDIIKMDVSAWYNTVFPSNDALITMEMFRNSFMFLFGLDQVLPAEGLVNDTMLIAKTISPEELSGGTVIRSICELNGCFGHIGRDGKFHYITLERNIQGLYPRKNLYPSKQLFPKTPKTFASGAKKSYISDKYEDYLVKTIDKLQIRQEENDIGIIINEAGANAYIIEDNFLVYGKSSDELEQIARNIFKVITKLVYRPFSAEVKGNPCFEVGDPVRISTQNKLVESYVLERTLTGIQALRDNFAAKGQEYQSKDVNSTHRAIIQLKGKTNIITRTVEENRREMLDIEAGLSFTIAETAKGLQADIAAERIRATGEEEKLSTSLTLTAEGLEAEIERATGEEEKLSTSLTLTAEGLEAEIERATGEEEKLSTSLTLTAEGLEAEIERATGEEEKLSTSLTLTAEGLEAEIERAAGEEDKLRTAISALAGEIVLKVDANGNLAKVELRADPEDGTEFKVKADNISLTAEEVISLLSGGTINLSALNVNIKADNWSVDSKGNLVCNSITAFKIKGDAVEQFNSAVSDSEAYKLAQKAISDAAGAAVQAQTAADTANTAIRNINTHIKNINDSIDKINGWIVQLSGQIKELGKPGIS